MTEQAQVGDTVRMTIIVEGEVYGGQNDLLYVVGWAVNRPNRTVEILSRATPPLPSEPGTFWLDRYDKVWRIDVDGELIPVAGLGRFLLVDRAPFRQLVLKND